MGKEATCPNSASDVGPQLKFVREPRYAPLVTMMWFDLLCHTCQALNASSLDHALEFSC